MEILGGFYDFIIENIINVSINACQLSLSLLIYHTEVFDFVVNSKLLSNHFRRNCVFCCWFVILFFSTNAAIALINVACAYKLRKAHKLRKQMISSQQHISADAASEASKDSNSTKQPSKQNAQLNAKNMYMTIMLLSVSVTSVILTLPVNFGFLIQVILFRRGYTENPINAARFMLCNEVYYMLATLNSVINFYVFCISGKKFRDEFKSMFSFENFKQKKRHLWMSIFDPSHTASFMIMQWVVNESYPWSVLTGYLLRI